MSVVRPRLSAEARRQSLLAAARRVFGRRGYIATSIDEIVREAGVSPPILYDHFASKRELYIELLARHTDELISRVGRAAQGQRGAEARLRASYEAFFTLVEEEPFTSRMIAGEDGGDPQIAAAVRARDEQGRHGVAEILGATGRLYGGQPDQQRSIELLAQMLRHGLNGLAMWWHAHPNTPRTVLVERAMDLSWVGIRGLRTAARRHDK